MAAWMTVRVADWPLLFLLLALVVGCSPSERDGADAEGGTATGDAAGQGELPTQRVTIAGRAFELELALNSDTRYRGLSDRAHIPEDGGMLFVFPEPGLLSFVMRDCLVPIDLIYLDANGRIMNMHAMEVEPYGRSNFLLKPYRSAGHAQFAVELAGGTIDQLGIEPGQSIDLPLEALKQQAR